ncbi:hypothetical protein GF377_01140 [candidate division GN15 bacterium]|nr:hypothetical protein [candidate division GN15 bacterium]
MLRSLKDLVGSSIGATDGELGKLSDLCFDDIGWIMRYAVVDTNKWLPGGKVLVPLLSFGQPDQKGDVFGVQLTKEQVKEAPPVDVDHPVSKQQETKLLKHMNIPPVSWSADSPLQPPEKKETVGEKPERLDYDPHLRSVKEIKGYELRGRGESVGEVYDLIADDDGWTVRYLVVDTGSWLKGRRVAFSVDGVSEVNWEGSRIKADVDRNSIQQYPEYKGPETLVKP